MNDRPGTRVPRAGSAGGRPHRRCSRRAWSRPCPPCSSDSRLDAALEQRGLHGRRTTLRRDSGCIRRCRRCRCDLRSGPCVPDLRFSTVASRSIVAYAPGLSVALPVSNSTSPSVTTTPRSVFLPFRSASSRSSALRSLVRLRLLRTALASRPRASSSTAWRSAVPFSISSRGLRGQDLLVGDLRVACVAIVRLELDVGELAALSPRDAFARSRDFARFGRCWSRRRRRAARLRLAARRRAQSRVPRSLIGRRAACSQQRCDRGGARIKLYVRFMICSSRSDRLALSSVVRSDRGDERSASWRSVLMLASQLVRRFARARGLRLRHGELGVELRQLRVPLGLLLLAVLQRLTRLRRGSPSLAAGPLRPAPSYRQSAPPAARRFRCGQRALWSDPKRRRTAASKPSCEREIGSRHVSSRNS